MLLLPIGMRSCLAIGRDILVRIEGQVVHLEGLIGVAILFLKSDVTQAKSDENQERNCRQTSLCIVIQEGLT